MSTTISSTPTSARKPAFKRRRLNHAIDPVCQSGRALTDNSNVAPASAPFSSPLSSPLTKLACSTCHRALSAAIRPGMAGLSMCSRCAAPTCAICARTCTSYTRPASFPPTPALTRSPSPCTHATTPVSPKRTPVCLGYAMHSDASLFTPSVSSMKRKKAPSDRDGPDGDGDTHGRVVLNLNLNLRVGGDPEADGRGPQEGVAGMLALDVRESTESTLIHGCGRVVCRACCVESIFNDGKLCVDCYALV